LMVGILFFYSSDRVGERITADHTHRDMDVAPPSESKAVLVLADGSKIQIDDRSNGVLAVQGKINIIKQSDDEISYSGQVNDRAGHYNTLTVPMGSKPINLTLSDGSRVWINVGSSLTYP